jgi:hypothetical protein
VIALNFPIAVNPGLARALGTTLKQDFQRAVLNRIHRPDRDANGRRPAPCSLGGTTLIIRKFQSRFFTAEGCLESGR